MSGDPVADGGEQDLHDQLGHGAGQGTGAALKHRPVKPVPENGGKVNENDDGENKVVNELAEEGGHIGAHGVSQLSVGVLAKSLANEPVEHIVDYRGREKSHRAAQQNEPCAAENTVKGGVVRHIGGDGACHKENEAGEKVDGGSQKGDLVGCLGAKVLGDDVHAHEGQPGDQNSAVQRDPLQLQQGLVCQQIHADHADHKESYHRCGNGTEEDLHFGEFFLNVHCIFADNGDPLSPFHYGFCVLKTIIPQIAAAVQGGVNGSGKMARKNPPHFRVKDSWWGKVDSPDLRIGPFRGSDAPPARHSLPLPFESTGINKKH